MFTPSITTNAEVLLDLNAMQSLGWRKVYVTTAHKPSKTWIMWITPDESTCHPTPIARAVYRASLPNSSPVPPVLPVVEGD